ncbi:MAG: hypothetical protein L3J51_07335 [Cocleimonas sp.]|nr:hypothetical protein [Cocleimonas sp.]
MKFRIIFRIVVVSLALLLSGYSFSPILELVYFSRVKFTLMDKAEENKYIYLCKKKETEEKTRENAIAANDFFVAGLDKISRKFVDSMMQDEEKDSDSNDTMTKAILGLNDESEKLAKNIESKFQCLMIDHIDLDE